MHKWLECSPAVTWTPGNMQPRHASWKLHTNYSTGFSIPCIAPPNLPMQSIYIYMHSFPCMCILLWLKKSELNKKMCSYSYTGNRYRYIHILIRLVANNIPYCNVKRFTGLNIRGFSPMKFFMETLLRCLGQQCLLFKYSQSWGNLVTL